MIGSIASIAPQFFGCHIGPLAVYIKGSQLFIALILYTIDPVAFLLPFSFYETAAADYWIGSFGGFVINGALVAARIFRRKLYGIFQEISAVRNFHHNIAASFWQVADFLFRFFNRSEGLVLSTVTGIIVSRSRNIKRMRYVSALSAGIIRQRGSCHRCRQAAQ